MHPIINNYVLAVGYVLNRFLNTNNWTLLQQSWCCVFKYSQIRACDIIVLIFYQNQAQVELMDVSDQQMSRYVFCPSLIRMATSEAVNASPNIKHCIVLSSFYRLQIYYSYVYTPFFLSLNMLVQNLFAIKD